MGQSFPFLNLIFLMEEIMHKKAQDLGSAQIIP